MEILIKTFNVENKHHTARDCTLSFSDFGEFDVLERFPVRYFCDIMCYDDAKSIFLDSAEDVSIQLLLVLITLC